jgi:hypothetical protein
MAKWLAPATVRGACGSDTFVNLDPDQPQEMAELEYMAEWLLQP